MPTENLNLNENCVYVGVDVTFKGTISAPDAVVIAGTVEGDVTARTVHIATGGAIKGSLVANDADIRGALSEKVEIKEFLYLHSTARIEGDISCGDIQAEKGAEIVARAFTVGNATFAEKPTEAAKIYPTEKVAHVVQLKFQGDGSSVPKGLASNGLNPSI